MNDAEREAFRIGAVSAVRGTMGADAAKMADMTKYLRSPEMRAKIGAMMPTPEAAASWAKRLDFEVGSSELTGRALGNSATARRLAEQQDANGLVGDLVLESLAGSPVTSLWRRVIMAAPKAVRDTLRSRSDRMLADVLTDPAAVANLRSFLDRAERSARPISGTAISGATAGANAAINAP